MIPEQLIELLILDKVFERMDENSTFNHIIRNNYNVEKMSTRRQSLFNDFMYQYLLNYANS